MAGIVAQNAAGAQLDPRDGGADAGGMSAMAPAVAAADAAVAPGPELPAPMDIIQEGLYTRKEFFKQQYKTMVITDGAHLADVAVGQGFDVQRLTHFLTEDADGPQVHAPGAGASLNAGWHWVDSEDSRGHLADRGVGDAFDLHLYKNIAGRQSAQVDAKVQALIRWCFAAQPSHKRVRLVLVAGDGDHAPALWHAVERFLLRQNAKRERQAKRGVGRKDARVDVWILGTGTAAVSHRLKVCPDMPVRRQVAVEVRYLIRGGFAQVWNLPRVLDAWPQAREKHVKDFVEAVFPHYDSPSFPRSQALLRNPGLHSLVEHAWQDPLQCKIFVVNGLTGSGKSTQIPQLLYDLIAYKRWHMRDENTPFRRPRVICTQPRRLACSQVSERVGIERQGKALPWDETHKGTFLGQDTVGYHIGGLRRCTDETPLVYCTAGVAVRQLIHSRDLAWDVMVLDEAHERSKEFDLLLALLLSPDVLTGERTIVIMSATLEDMVEKLRTYCARRIERFDDNHPWLADPRFIQSFDITSGADTPGIPVRDSAAFAAYEARVEAGTFDVDIHYLDDLRRELRDDMPFYDMVGDVDWGAVFEPTRRDRGRAEAEGQGRPVIWQDRLNFIKIFLRYEVLRTLGPAGHKEVYLVFVPSMGMMKEIGIYLKHCIREYCDQHDIPPDKHPVVRYVHGQIGQEGNQVALERTAATRVMLATNVAESSLTIGDVTVVVDMCLQKRPVRADADHKRLNFTRAPKDSCVQRKGRVGRIRAGDKCYRMISRQEWDAAPAAREPDIESCNLDDWLLNLYQKFEHTGIDPRAMLYRCISPPHRADVKASTNVLLRTQLIAPPPGGGGGVHTLLPLGRLLHRLPIDLQLGRLIVWACLIDHDLGKLAVEFAAMAASESVIVDPILDGCKTAEERLKKYATRAWRYRQKAMGYSSDAVTLLALLSGYRECMLKSRPAGDGPTRPDRSVSEWCRKNYVSASEMEAVDYKIAQLRHELHRCRPLFPALPETLFAGGRGQRGVPTTGDVVDALRREEVQLTRENIMLLMVLHAGACAHASTAVSKETAPHGPVHMQFEFKFYDPPPTNFFKRVERVLTSQTCDACITCEERYDREGGRRARTRDMKVQVRLYDSDEGSTPLDSVYMLAQLGSCAKEVFAERNLQRCNVTCPGYEFRTDRTVYLKPWSMLRPILTGEPEGLDGRVYPTSITSHQSMERRDQYTDVLSVVTFLPDTLRHPHADVTLADVLDGIFAPGQALRQMCDLRDELGERVYQEALRVQRDLLDDSLVNKVLANAADILADDESDDATPLAPPHGSALEIEVQGAARGSLRASLLHVVCAVLGCEDQRAAADVFRQHY